MRKLFLLSLFFICKYASSQTNYYITSEDGTKLFVQEFGKGDPVIVLAGGPGLKAVYLKDLYDKLSEKYRCSHLTGLFF